jgi:uncharacterized membrane protein YcaP (DUF421 family)
MHAGRSALCGKPTATLHPLTACTTYPGHHCPTHARATIQLEERMINVLRAVYGYCLLIFIVRVVGRRPGKQMAPSDFVLIFFIGGLTLTTIVADDHSLTNALAQIITVAGIHFALTWLRRHSAWFSRALDGTPLVLMNNGKWHTEALKNMHFSHDDVRSAARQKGLVTLDQIQYAVLERNGDISLIERGK